MNLCSATMPNSELFCFLPMVRIWLLPGLTAGVRQEQLFWYSACLKVGATGNLTTEQNPLLFGFVFFFNVLSFQSQNSELVFKHLGLFQGLVVWLSCSIDIHFGPSNDYLCPRLITSLSSLQVQEKEENKANESKQCFSVIYFTNSLAVCSSSNLPCSICLVGQRPP